MLVVFNFYSKRCFFIESYSFIVLYFYNLLFLIFYRYIEGFSLKLGSVDLFLSSFNIYMGLVFLRYHSLTKFTSLMDITAIDYPNRRYNRFELTYVLWSSYYSFPITVKTMGGSNLALSSVSSLFRSANWLEREVWDMYGIKFLFHPNLRRILTDYGFKGYPLRKDFPLIGFIELRYDDLYKSVLVEPVELSQNVRFFSFKNSWNNYD